MGALAYNLTPYGGSLSEKEGLKRSDIEELIEARLPGN